MAESECRGTPDDDAPDSGAEVPDAITVTGTVTGLATFAHNPTASIASGVLSYDRPYVASRSGAARVPRYSAGAASPGQMRVTNQIVADSRTIVPPTTYRPSAAWTIPPTCFSPFEMPGRG